MKPKVVIGLKIRITSYNVCYTKLLRVRWVKIPVRCKTAGSSLSDGNKTLTCNLGNQPEGTSGTFSPIAKVGLKWDAGENKYVQSNNDVVAVSASINTDQSTPVTSNTVNTTISAQAAGDWTIGAADLYYDINKSATEKGVVFIYPLTFVPSSGGSLLGTEPLDDTKSMAFYDHAWDLGPSAMIATTDMMNQGINRAICGGYDGEGAIPYGAASGQTLPTEATVENTTASFDMTCTFGTGTTGTHASPGAAGIATYPLTKILIENQDTSVVPLKNANKGKNKITVISAQLAFWVSDGDIAAKAGGAGTPSDPFWNTINKDNTLDTNDANSTLGVLPYTENVLV